MRPWKNLLGSHLDNTISSQSSTAQTLTLGFHKACSPLCATQTATKKQSCSLAHLNSWGNAHRSLRKHVSDLSAWKFTAMLHTYNSENTAQKVVIKQNAEREPRASWRYWEPSTGWWRHTWSEISHPSAAKDCRGGQHREMLHVAWSTWVSHQSWCIIASVLRSIMWA